MEHIPRSLAPRGDISSAPHKFSVFVSMEFLLYRQVASGHMMQTALMQGWATTGFNLNSGFLGVENIIFSSAIVA